MASDHSDHRHSAEDDLRMNRQQVPVLEAIVTAMDDARGVLDVLLDAADPDDARRRLRERYGFTEVQASAVLDVQFRRVTSSERQKIREHLLEVTARVAALEEELREG